jgi:hypothetical protein
VLEEGVYQIKDMVKFRAVSEVMHHRLLTAFHARPERLQKPAAAAGTGEEKDEAPTDEPDDVDSKNDTTAATEQEIEQPAPQMPSP